MGQRLTLSILSKENDSSKIQDELNSENVDLCIYYHWSGYTESSIEEVLNIIPCIQEWKDGEDKSKEKLLDIISAKIFVEKEFNEKENKYEYLFHRNKGIPTISSESIKDMLNWSECPVNINIENDTVDFSGAFFPDEKSNYKNLKIVNLDEQNIDLIKVPFSKLKLLLYFIKEDDRTHVIWNNKKWALIR